MAGVGGGSGDLMLGVLGGNILGGAKGIVRQQ
jgi:hypothetical protein